MIRDTIINTSPITGVNPFDELPVDAGIWRTAHDHHHRHRFLHNMIIHRPGIVYGLEVLVRQDRTLLVAPGAAVDAEGRVIVLQEPVTFDMDEKGQFFITLSYKQPYIEQSAITVGGGEKYYAFLEGREVRNTKDVPGSDQIELARVYRTNPTKPVQNAVNPFDPGSDEINQLHRRLAFPHCYADVLIGELAYVPKAGGDWKPNRSGLWNLLQEGNGRGFHLEFAGPVNVTAEKITTWPAVLYIAGSQAFQPLSAQQIEGLRRFNEHGGVLLGDSSGADFTAAFTELAQQLGCPLEKLPAGHALLKAHYMFSATPPGAQKASAFRLDATGGVMLSEVNYGGAWQGEVPDPQAVDARERIRQAVEFGLNLAVFAAKRQRSVYLNSLVK